MVSSAARMSARQPETQDPLPRVRALDGVRGLAILLVMIHHFTLLPSGPRIDDAFHAVSRLGWTGVDSSNLVNVKISAENAI